MARAWILASCSWTGNGGGRLEQVHRRQLERPSRAAAGRRPAGSARRPAHAGRRSRAPATPGGTTGPAEPCTGIGAMDRVAAGRRRRSARTRGSSQSPDGDPDHAARRRPAAARPCRTGRRPSRGGASREPPGPARRSGPRGRAPARTGPVGGQDQDHAGGAEVDAPGRPRPAHRRSRRCRPAGWAGASARACGSGRGGDHERPARSRATGPSRSGTGRRRTSSRLTTSERRAAAASDDQPSVVNITWASAAPTGPQGLAGRSIGAARRPGPADRPGRSRPGSGPGRDRQAERDERCGSQSSLAQRHGTPSGAGRASRTRRPRRASTTGRRPVLTAGSERQPLPQPCRTSSDRPASPKACGFRGRSPARPGRASVHSPGWVRSTVSPSHLQLLGRLDGLELARHVQVDLLLHDLLDHDRHLVDARACRPAAGPPGSARSSASGSGSRA